MQNNKTLRLFEKICKNMEDEPVAAVSIPIDASIAFPKTLLLMFLIVSICELNVDCTNLSGSIKYQRENATTNPKNKNRKAINGLAEKAKPFESKKDCLERIIMQSCSSNKMKESDEELDQRIPNGE